MTLFLKSSVFNYFINTFYTVIFYLVFQLADWFVVFIDFLHAFKFVLIGILPFYCFFIFINPPNLEIVSTPIEKLPDSLWGDCDETEAKLLSIHKILNDAGTYDHMRYPTDLNFQKWGSKECKYSFDGTTENDGYEYAITGTIVLHGHDDAQVDYKLTTTKAKVK